MTPLDDRLQSSSVERLVTRLALSDTLSGPVSLFRGQRLEIPKVPFYGVSVNKSEQ